MELERKTEAAPASGLQTERRRSPSCRRTASRPGGRGHVTDPVAIVGLAQASAHPTMRANVASFDDDGITLRWAARPAETWVVHYLALGR